MSLPHHRILVGSVLLVAALGVSTWAVLRSDKKLINTDHSVISSPRPHVIAPRAMDEVPAAPAASPPASAVPAHTVGQAPASAQAMVLPTPPPELAGWATMSEADRLALVSDLQHNPQLSGEIILSLSA